MNPEYIGMLTLMVEPGTPLYDWVHDGSFRLLDQHQVLKETELLVSHFDSPGSVFRMNHASNYLDLRAHSIRTGMLCWPRSIRLSRISAVCGPKAGADCDSQRSHSHSFVR